MSSQIARRTVAVAASAITVLAMSGYAAGTSSAARPSPARSGASKHGSASAGNLDIRKGSDATGRVDGLNRAAQASARTATSTLTRSLGRQAVVDMDEVTGTPRMVARLNGYLTAPSRRPAATVALDYVRAHLAALGLTSADLSTLRLSRGWVDVAGIHHLSWTQWCNGIEVFSNGLQANVTKDGRLLSLGGSPVSGLRVPAAGKFAVGSGSAAIAAARRSQAEPATPGPSDNAQRMLFVTAAGTYLGWRTITMSAAHPAVSFVDAQSGKVLFRQSLQDDANAPAPSGDSTGVAYHYYPGAKVGGTQQPVDYTKKGWLAPTAKVLSGNNTHTSSDVDDDNKIEKSEEVPPLAGNEWDYPLQPFHLKKVSFCDNPWPCSWDPNKPFSWQTNRAQNAAQVFYYVNNWHDHLQAAPIGFTEAAGNFQVQNFTAEGKDGDPVLSQTDDGANTDNGLPDGNHVDNANMDTPPDGQSPTMQMYLQHLPHTSYPNGDPFSPTNVGDEADTVYHEYTHGLSNRLVVDADDVSTLGGVQAGAMGEAWSDWYAMDYLVANGYQKDNPSKVDVVIFQYDGAGVALDRTEPMDCKLGSPAASCPGGATGHSGGYTYADYGKIIGQPEVHADGEIWSQTLWELRGRLGSNKTEALVTRAMSLSPANPSFIDERNAILLADQAVYNGADQNAIWTVFAHRGMGYFAGALTGDDSSPGADFQTPPAQVRYGYLTGTITNVDTGKPAANIPVTLAFEGTPGLQNPTTKTTSSGHYRLGPVPAGTYPKVVAGGGGWLPVATSVTITEAGTQHDFSLRRDWALIAGGAKVADFNGPDYSAFGCGPAQALDANEADGWGSTTGDNAGDPTNTFVTKHLEVKLTKAITITSFQVDPSGTCGDDPSSSVGQYEIQTSADGTTWKTAAKGTFTNADVGRLNTVTPTANAAGVRYVKFVILGNQTPNFATACPSAAKTGCSYTDLTELEVLGG